MNDEETLGQREKLLLQKLTKQTRTGKLHWLAQDPAQTQMRAKAGASDFQVVSEDRDDRAPYLLRITHAGQPVAVMRTVEARTDDDAHLNDLLKDLYFTAKRSANALGPEADAVLRDLDL